MVKKHLRKESFVVVTAYDGGEGTTKFFNDSFELVILDIMMPKLDGIEVTARIKAAIRRETILWHEKEILYHYNSIFNIYSNCY